MFCVLKVSMPFVKSEGINNYSAELFIEAHVDELLNFYILRVRVCIIFSPLFGLIIELIPLVYVLLCDDCVLRIV